jgi:hypothetical protein
MAADKSNIVRFETNKPFEGALRYAGPGEEVDGRYGPQVLYTLIDGRKMYLALRANRKFQELRLGAGELFSIIKAETVNGQKRGVEWRITRIDPPGDPAPATPPRPPAPRTQTAPAPAPEPVWPKAEAPASQLEAQLRASMRPGAPPAPGAKLVPIAGNPEGQASAQELAATLAVSTTLLTALKTSISAFAEAEKFAKEINYAVRFEPQHIYGAAVSLVIGKQRENGNGGYK